MKKILLSLLVTLSVFSARAAVYDYSMCKEGEISGVGNSQSGITYSASIEVPENVAQTMIGSKVTGMSVGFAQGNNKVLYLFLTYDPKGEPFYEQEVRVKVNRYNDYTFDTPYVIEGKKFYIGYRYRTNTSSGRPIGFDGDRAAGSPLFAHLGAKYDDGEYEWMTAEMFGNLCIKATIEGDNLPFSAAMPAGITCEQNSGLNSDFPYTLRFRNFSNEPITKLGIHTNVQGVEADKEVTISAPVQPGAFGEVALTASFTKEQQEAPLSVKITSVNGGENLFATQASSATVLVSNYVHPRVLVMEKLSGVDCGWCPRGIVAIEQMTEEYPNTFIGISFQNYSTSDPMYCGAYDPVTRVYAFNGAPSAWMSRNRGIGSYDASPSPTHAAYNQLAGVVGVNLKVYAEMEEGSKTELKTTTTAEFGTSTDNTNYGIAIALTEDGLGPYTQRNTYSGGTYGSMGGWEGKETRVSMVYDHIARTIVDWDGATGAIPANVELGERYIHERNVTLKDSWNKDKISVIAMLIDKSTGEIVTAAKCPIGTSFDASVDMVNDASNSIDIQTAAGSISVYGADAAQIFSTDGKQVASFRNGTANVTPGIYVVRATAKGQTLTRKVAVR
ncbi:MAG: Omp28-related outer membrane protein [Prevotella sp.]|nr:Omp28-related outer membrane protein [Prevotella sp.]MCM1074865.1 Omp28-related outer membrane protein [Ruminococcus sp.]